MEKLILPAIHLSILIGFIAYKTKAPFREFLKARFKEISDGLNRSKIQAQEAKAKQQELEKKLSNLEQEKAKIFAEFNERQQAQVKEIKESGLRILAQMKIEASQNKLALEESVRLQTTKKFSQMVLAQAEEKIKKQLNAETHKNLNSKFESDLGLAKTSFRSVEA